MRLTAPQKTVLVEYAFQPDITGPEVIEPRRQVITSNGPVPTHPRAVPGEPAAIAAEHRSVPSPPVTLRVVTATSGWPAPGGGGSLFWRKVRVTVRVAASERADAPLAEAAAGVADWMLVHGVHHVSSSGSDAVRVERAPVPPDRARIVAAVAGALRAAPFTLRPGVRAAVIGYYLLAWTGLAWVFARAPGA